MKLIILRFCAFKLSCLLAHFYRLVKLLPRNRFHRVVKIEDKEQQQKKKKKTNVQNYFRMPLPYLPRRVPLPSRPGRLPLPSLPRIVPLLFPPSLSTLASATTLLPLVSGPALSSHGEVPLPFPPRRVAPAASPSAVVYSD